MDELFRPFVPDGTDAALRKAFKDAASDAESQELKHGALTLA
jgi:hypothetical protein